MQAPFKVTRTWYIYADSPVDAIQKTKGELHDEVRSSKMKSKSNVAKVILNGKKENA